MEKLSFRIELDVCPTPILLVGHDGAVVRTNTKFDALFGYRSGELSGQSVEALVPESVRKRHPGFRRSFLQQPSPRAMGSGRDLHAVRRDGTLLPVEVGLDPISLEGQDLIMVSILDIRERKKHEEMTLNAVNAASSAMVQVDGAGRIEMANTQTTELFGYATEELLGEAIELLIPKRFRIAHISHRSAYRKVHETRPMGAGRDLFGLRKDGSEFPVEIGLTPVHGRRGRSTMATIIDITDRKADERRIRRQNQQLRNLNTELLEFAYSASHNLKAPLASIAGLLDFCGIDLASGDVAEVRKNLLAARALADRLSGRIEDMQSLAGAEIQASAWEPVAIGDLLEEVWSCYAQSGMRFNTALSHEEPILSIATRLRTIFENLMSNAVKFRRSDSDCSQLWVRSWTRNDIFFLAFEDNGIGIPEEQQKKIFRLYHRASVAAEPGSGLGLALVRKHLSFLHGDISCHCESDRTVFTISLPQTIDKAYESTRKVGVA